MIAVKYVKMSTANVPIIAEYAVFNSKKSGFKGKISKAAKLLNNHLKSAITQSVKGDYRIEILVSHLWIKKISRFRVEKFDLMVRQKWIAKIQILNNF